jgi:hypothetical protein
MQKGKRCHLPFKMKERWPKMSPAQSHWISILDWDVNRVPTNGNIGLTNNVSLLIIDNALDSITQVLDATLLTREPVKFLLTCFLDTIIASDGSFTGCCWCDE